MVARHYFVPYERVYLSLYKVKDTPFHIQGNDLLMPSDFEIGLEGAPG